MEPSLCTIPDCGRDAWCGMGRGGRLLCYQHHRRWKRTGSVGGPIREYMRGVEQCLHPDCARTDIAGKGYCLMHYRREHRHGDVDHRVRAANGSREAYEHQGYRYVRIGSHPNMGNNGFIREHTLVMSQMLGRPLRRGENVHHKNGVRNDNRPENLELWVKTQPAGQRVVDIVAWAHEILAMYGNETGAPSWLPTIT